MTEIIRNENHRSGYYQIPPTITNKLYVKGTTSDAEDQICIFDVENGPKIVSYKCCEAEDGKLTKGGDYMFTITAANMGECEGYTKINDILSINNVGMVHFKVMDTCEPSNYKLWIYAYIKYPTGWGWGWYPLIPGLEFKVIDNWPAYIYVKGYYGYTIKLDAHEMLCIGALFQAENISCHGYYDEKDSVPAPPPFKEPTEEESKQIEETLKAMCEKIQGNN